MKSPVFNVAYLEVAPITPRIGGERWVQLRFHHTGDDSPLLVQMSEHAWVTKTFVGSWPRPDTDP